MGDVFCGVGFEEGLAAVTTEGDEVEVLCLLVALEAGRHGGTSSLHPTLRKKREGWGTRGLVRGPPPSIELEIYQLANRCFSEDIKTDKFSKTVVYLVKREMWLYELNLVH